MIELKNAALRVELQEETGYTAMICGHDGINWVLPCSDWGRIEGFSALRSLVRTKDGVRAEYMHEQYPVRAIVEKEMRADMYVERYTIRNDDFIEFFFREGDLGIHFPFDNALHPNEPWLERSVNAHVWCGNEIAWIQAKRFNGNAPFLYVYMTKGNLCSYDISRDVCRANRGIDYRGDLVLNPQPTPILPGQTLTTEFSIHLDNRQAEAVFSDFAGHIALNAAPYTSLNREPIEMTADYSGTIQTASVTLDGEGVDFRKDDNRLCWTLTPECFREYTYRVEINGKRTWMRVNAMPSLQALLQARARFIARKQQYHCTGSHLDGAYLIYERSDDSLYFSRYFRDHNAGRERIAMGLTVIQALLNQPDEELETSLKAYVTFVERELFDAKTGEVFESENRDNSHVRIFNYPWFACFYLELYRLWGRHEHLMNAAKIIRLYYAQNGSEQDSQCIPMLELVRSLEDTGELETAQEMQAYFVSHVHSMIRRSMYSPNIEGACAPEGADTCVSYFCQVFLLTGDSKYAEMLSSAKAFGESYFACQPDVHMHRMGLRHWDGYWFGSYMQYGDLFPHQWNCLTGEMYHFLALAEHKSEYDEIARDIYCNNLCGFEPDGFAPSSYLYPHKITMYASDPAYDNPMMPLGIAYGGRYDTWANEQDWALYYAAKRLLCDATKQHS